MWMVWEVWRKHLAAGAAKTGLLDRIAGKVQNAAADDTSSDAKR